MSRRVLVASAVTVALAVGLAVFARSRTHPDSKSASPRVTSASGSLFSEPEDTVFTSATQPVSDDVREDALQRAQVWKPPPRPIARAVFDGRHATGIVDCRFRIVELGGTTPKFNCVLETGGDIRIKYGIGSEIPAEAAATRLLTALGFGADRVMLIERLRCYGCPLEPFLTTKAADKTHTSRLLEHVVDGAHYKEFEWVAAERRFPAHSIESRNTEGWAFFELDRIDSTRGGAPSAHVDALRLLAVFLAHWDNKPSNQRLVCLTGNWEEGKACPEPFVLLQDVGSTFGPKKADLDGWKAASIWEDRSACQVTMRDFPYDGGTFDSRRISEGGRRFLAGLLTQLSEAQVTALFAGARFDERRNILKDVHPVSDWVRVFRAKVDSIAGGPPCPD